MPDLRRRAPDLLAGLMATVGSTHFVAADVMAQTIPPQLPARKALVYVSGVVEVACAVGLARRTPWARPLAAATLLAIWPANIQMALDAGTGKNRGVMDNKAIMWARVPLQLPLVWAALQARPR
jgi:uncharacterized membrane protein